MSETAYPAQVGEVNQTPQIRPPLELASLLRDFLERLMQERADRQASIVRAQGKAVQP